MSSFEGVFGGLNISASGMRAQRVRQNVITSNLANAETTRTTEGGPYKRQFVVFEADGVETLSGSGRERGLGGVTTKSNHMGIPGDRFMLENLRIGSGVRVGEIRSDSREPQLIHQPDHPDADANGYVAMPNVNIVEEMADMISATRAYEANVTAFNATKTMLLDAVNM